ncbi:Transposase [Pseudomonas cuatrocienegasensis]|uniref:Transposase n=1 Tax=Pseudomonas cuatrocienegasensis TaxID=543360 RepID=A0ABY1BMQ2_9PSED|nr:MULTISPECIES: transposase [Pseudomonas]OEC32570.1 transposase [Pseudomonas sp. 21C1]SER20337.1 Transposase [Pseudomonas cuatrocienegasensis]
MPRFKTVHKGLKLLPIDFDKQLLSGTFEHALCYLVDHELDLCDFHTRYRNSAEGAPAYDPAVLLKIVLLAYSRGIISSRQMEAACRDHVLFMAISGDSQPHFTTLAHFVSSMGDLAAKLFAQVLAVCDRQGLIGREMFAIDGVKLPSNGSKSRSGTRADFIRQAEKMEKAAQAMIERQRQCDKQPEDEAQRAARKLERLQADARQLRAWLNDNTEDRKGAKGRINLSNRTDNESAKMATSKGVIQGYTGVAAVDEKAQIIVEAQAHGTGAEQALLEPIIHATDSLRSPDTCYTADAGYHSRKALEQLEAAGITAFIPDNGYRKRDERYAGQQHHLAKPDPLWDKGPKRISSHCYTPADFHFDPLHKTCTCPAGKTLYGNGSHCLIKGQPAIKFKGALRDCLSCLQRKQCLRTPEKTAARQVAFFLPKAEQDNALSSMRQRIDSSAGREMITRRFATVEPVFGNLRHNKRLNRFILRGRERVDGQWKLYCMTHNIEKLAHRGAWS